MCFRCLHQMGVACTWLMRGAWARMDGSPVRLTLTLRQRVCKPSSLLLVYCRSPPECPQYSLSHPTTYPHRQYVSFDSFFYAVTWIANLSKDEVVWMVFSAFDGNSDGVLEVEERRALLVRAPHPVPLPTGAYGVLWPATPPPPCAPTSFLLALAVAPVAACCRLLGGGCRPPPPTPPPPHPTLTFFPARSCRWTWPAACWTYGRSRGWTVTW
jgi:hypothetical protein